MENTLLYCLTIRGQKTYILGSLDSVIGSYSVSRPADWEAYVSDVFDAVNPSEIITPISMQSCYAQYNGVSVPSAGFNTYTLSSSSTASMVLRKAICHSNYMAEQENRPYTFKGIMTRPFYYSYCVGPLVQTIFLTHASIMSPIYPEVPAIKSIMETYLGEKFFESMLSNRVARIRKVLLTIFSIPNKTHDFGHPAIHVKFHSMATIICAKILTALSIKLNELFANRLQMLSSSSFLARFLAFLAVIGSIKEFNLLNNIVFKHMQGLFSAFSSLRQNLMSRAPIVSSVLTVPEYFFDSAAYMLSESFYGRVFIVDATKKYLFSDNPQTLNTESIFTYLQIPQYVIGKACQFLGYSSTLPRLNDGPNIEVSPNKLAIVPFSILAGKDGVLATALPAHIQIKPCLLLSIPATEEREAHKEIREFHDLEELQRYLALRP